MIEKLHDAIDAREDSREAATGAVNEVWEGVTGLGAAITEEGGSFLEVLEAIALAVEDRVTDLTTDAVRAGLKSSKARNEVRGGG